MTDRIKAAPTNTNPATTNPATTDRGDGGTLGRRDLFRVAGLGVGALGAVVAGVSAVTGPADAVAAETKTTGYRETDHVRKVYELSRF